MNTLILCICLRLLRVKMQRAKLKWIFSFVNLIEMSISRCIAHMTTHAYHCIIFSMYRFSDTRQWKFCKSKFCVQPKRSLVQTEYSQTESTKYSNTRCVYGMHWTACVSWISTKTKIGANAVGRPMKQKIRIYAIRWL